MPEYNWNTKTSTWSNDTSSWPSAAHSVSATFGASTSVASTGNTIYPVAVTMTQVILSELNEEDTVFPRSLSMGMSAGMTSTGQLSVPVTATLANGQTIKMNINFEELATLAATSGISSDNSFLWNDIAEDTGTTWTKISDPDE